jgi:hypothetical protein
LQDSGNVWQKFWLDPDIECAHDDGFCLLLMYGEQS